MLTSALWNLLVDCCWAKATLELDLWRAAGPWGVPCLWAGWEGPALVNSPEPRTTAALWWGSDPPTPLAPTCGLLTSWGQFGQLGTHKEDGHTIYQIKLTEEYCVYNKYEYRFIHLLSLHITQFLVLYNNMPHWKTTKCEHFWTSSLLFKEYKNNGCFVNIVQQNRLLYFLLIIYLQWCEVTKYIYPSTILRYMYFTFQFVATLYCCSTFTSYN